MKCGDLEKANTFPRRGKHKENIWNVTLLKKLHIKWVIKMTNQSQAVPKEAQFKQVALWEAYIIQLAPEKVQAPDNNEISIIYLHMKKNGIKIFLSLTIYFLSK